MSKTDSAFETAAQRMVGGDRGQPLAALEARAAVAEAIVAVKGEFDPSDLVPRLISPSPVKTAPIIEDTAAAMREMSRFDNTPGRRPYNEWKARACRHEVPPGSWCSLCFEPPPAGPDFKVGDTWHRNGCDGNCDIAFGCAAQWHEEEIAAMTGYQSRSGSMKTQEEALNRIKPRTEPDHALLRHMVMLETMKPVADFIADAKIRLAPNRVQDDVNRFAPQPKPCQCYAGQENCLVHGPLAKPSLRGKTSAERKAEPIHSGVMLYFPDALAAIARLSKAGNDKHNPGEPLHWARGKSMDQMDASARHMLTLGKVDPETKELEAVANGWRALAELQLLEEKRLIAAGIMPYSGVTE